MCYHVGNKFHAVTMPLYVDNSKVLIRYNKYNISWIWYSLMGDWLVTTRSDIQCEIQCVLHSIYIVSLGLFRWLMGDWLVTTKSDIQCEIQCILHSIYIVSLELFRWLLPISLIHLSIEIRKLHFLDNKENQYLIYLINDHFRKQSFSNENKFSIDLRVQSLCFLFS